MAWNNPQKLALDQVVTASWMNANLRDNLNHLYTFSSVRGNSNTIQSQLFNGVSVSAERGAEFVYSIANGVFEMVIDGGSWRTATLARASTAAPYFQIFVPHTVVGDAPPVYACALYNPAAGEWFVGITVPSDGQSVTAAVLLTAEFSSPAPNGFSISWYSLSAYCANRTTRIPFTAATPNSSYIEFPKIIRRPYIARFDGFFRIGVDNAFVGVHGTTPKRRDWQVLSASGTTVTASRVINATEAVQAPLFNYPCAVTGWLVNGGSIDSLVADFNYSQDSSITARTICYTSYADYGAKGGVWFTTSVDFTLSAASINAFVTML